MREVKFSLTLYVRERPRTVRMFLDSLEKNSYWSGHEVLWVADPEWVNPSDPNPNGAGCDPYTDDGPISMKAWLEKYGGRYRRISIKVVEGWNARTWRRHGRERKKVIDVCRGFNFAVRNALQTEYVITSMACDMYWAPNWDVNLAKWLDKGDMIVPRYVEPHRYELGRPTLQRSGSADLLFLEPWQSQEREFLSIVQEKIFRPGVAICESPRHRIWSHSIAITLSRETFEKIGGFRELPHPESTDLMFDDDAGRYPLVKVIPMDCFAIHGTVYVPSMFADQTIQPGPKNPLWSPEVNTLLRSQLHPHVLRDDPRGFAALREIPAYGSNIPEEVLWPST